MNAGELYAVALHDGRWGAVQAIAADAVVALDWVGDVLPTVADLAGVEPMVIDHHNHHPGKVLRTRVKPAPPAGVELVGRAELVFDGKAGNPYSWRLLPYQMWAQWRWSHELPKEVVAAYRVAKASREELTIELGGVEHGVRADTWKMSVGEDGMYAFAADAVVDWAQLDALGALTHLSYNGGDASFVDYLARKPLMHDASWSAPGRDVVDLRNTQLCDFGIAVGSAIQLHLPATLRKLRLGIEPGATIVVHHPRQGRGLELSVGAGDTLPGPIKGLEQLTALSTSAKVAELSQVVGYRHLAELDLHGIPGRLTGLAELANMPALRRLELADFFDMDADMLPARSDMPLLQTVIIDGLRKRDAAIVRQKLKGIDTLVVQRAKNDDWIRGNANNPLRNWHDNDSVLGDKACKAFRKTFNKARKLGDGAKLAEAEAVLREFIDVLNQLDGKYGVDTIMREEAYDALVEVAERLPVVTDEQLSAWFDDWRDF